MADVMLGAIVSIITGVGLWAVLPRGVVLTRAVRAQNLAGDAMYDTWEVKNDSALPVRITSVTFRAPHTYDDRRGSFRWATLSSPADRDDGVVLHFDDSVTEMKRLDQDRDWADMRVLPGDSLEATVLNNRDLRICYRRSGIFGVFERRELLIHGGA